MCTYGGGPVVATHFSVDHLLLARRRRSCIGHAERVEEVIARIVSCSDFRDSLPFVLHVLRRLRSCWLQGQHGSRRMWTAKWTDHDAHDSTGVVPLNRDLCAQQ